MVAKSNPKSKSESASFPTQIYFDDGSGQTYDDLKARVNVPVAGWSTIVTKDNATESGKPILQLTFPVMLPPSIPAGQIARTHTVMTVETFLRLADVIRSQYPELAAPSKS